MADPWRLRCPQGHASIRNGKRTSGYRCTACNERYPGEPVDAAAVDEFPVDTDPVDQPSPDEILTALVDIQRRDQRAFVRATELTGRSHGAAISPKLATLHDDGLIRNVSRSGRNLWQPTEAGLNAVGGDSDA